MQSCTVLGLIERYSAKIMTVTVEKLKILAIAATCILLYMYYIIIESIDSTIIIVIV